MYGLRGGGAMGGDLPFKNNVIAAYLLNMTNTEMKIVVGH